MIDMGYDLKEEYLNKKYAEYDDEADGRYMKKRHVQKPVKKSDHKHKYENVVVVDPNHSNSFGLVGRCSVCGKIGNVQHDKRIDKKFPNVNYTSWLLGYTLGFENEYEAFEDWCKKHYTVYEIEGFNLLDNKYL